MRRVAAPKLYAGLHNQMLRSVEVAGCRGDHLLPTQMHLLAAQPPGEGGSEL